MHTELRRRALLAPIMLLFGCGSSSSDLDVYFVAHRPVPASEVLLGLMRDVKAQRGSSTVTGRQCGGSAVLSVNDLVSVPHGDAEALGTLVIVARDARTKTRSFYRANQDILDTPYWTSLFSAVSATGGGRVYESVNLSYPIRVYGCDAEQMLGAIGAPPHWRQAERPKLGEFAPENREKWYDYLRSFTIITGLAAVADTVLVVNHGVFTPSEENPRHVQNTHLDVYVNGRRVLTGLPSPGEIVAYSQQSIFFAQSSAKQVPFEIIEYTWRH